MIFALASGRGTAGVAIIRISGSGISDIVAKITRGRELLPRKASLCNLYDPVTELIIDRALIIYFPTPHSFTGEDVIELHVHGGQAIINKISDILINLHVRPAFAGEFTQRSFNNDKIDLSQAEGLADLIMAQTEEQRRLAFNQMEGVISRLYQGWRSMLICLIARLEAIIDFPDEELDISSKISDELIILKQQLLEQLTNSQKTQQIRSGTEITIIGLPNVGKSSLLNRIAGSDYAIVSDIAGTTRDAIEVQLDLSGFKVILVDTAGLRTGTGLCEIEQEGIRRSVMRAKAADFVIHVTTPHVAINSHLNDNDIIVINKCDLLNDFAQPGNVKGTVMVSALTGLGIEDLINKLTDNITAITKTNNPSILSRRRHQIAVSDSIAAIDRALTPGLPLELCIEDLRQALRSLGKIIGLVDVEEILSEIFSSFCIGK